MAVKLLTIFAFAGICLAAALLVSAEEQGEHVLVKRSGNGWFKAPGSPTSRHTIKDAGGQQVDHTVDHSNGHVTSGYLALGKNARDDSPHRTGQPHSGGAASTSEKKPKKKGH
ncbi:uncharacterized protein LOC117650512 [Thrips palmi]|uniref:Uncharacterized protein LOC117650512 n=1 Tax=Thrips palmi TaxID=161013 RepID=A0A6P8ZYP5_THRPL|nr:uncharacterized protein LOC117650512 [Thrips palmi]